MMFGHDVSSRLRWR